MSLGPCRISRVAPGDTLSTRSGAGSTDLRGAKEVPRKGFEHWVSMRARTCKESNVKRDQTSCFLRLPFLGTPLVESRPMGPPGGMRRPQCVRGVHGEKASRCPLQSQEDVRLASAYT